MMASAGMNVSRFENSNTWRNAEEAKRLFWGMNKGAGLELV